MDDNYLQKGDLLMLNDHKTVVKVVPVNAIPENFNVLSMISKNTVLVINSDFEDNYMVESSEEK